MHILGYFVENWLTIYSWVYLGAVYSILGFPGGSVVKNPPAIQKTQVLSLGQEDPLEKEMASCSSILA